MRCTGLWSQSRPQTWLRFRCRAGKVPERRGPSGLRFRRMEQRRREKEVVLRGFESRGYSVLGRGRFDLVGRCREQCRRRAALNRHRPEGTVEPATRGSIGPLVAIPFRLPVYAGHAVIRRRGGFADNAGCQPGHGSARGCQDRLYNGEAHRQTGEDSGRKTKASSHRNREDSDRQLQLQVLFARGELARRLGEDLALEDEF